MENHTLIEIEDRQGKKVVLNPVRVSALVRGKESGTVDIHLFGVESPISVDAGIDEITEIILKSIDFYNQSVMELMVETVKKEMRKDSGKKEVFH